MNFKKTLASAFLWIPMVSFSEPLTVGVYKAESGNSLLMMFARACSKTDANAYLIAGGKQIPGCHSSVGDKVQFDFQDGTTSRVFDAAQLVVLGEVPDLKIANASAVTPNKPKSSHLLCEADDSKMELDVERNPQGELVNVSVAGTPVFAREVGTQLLFSHDGYKFSLSTISGNFQYETDGVQNYVRKSLFGKGGSKGTGSCKLVEVAKKF